MRLCGIAVCVRKFAGRHPAGCDYHGDFRSDCYLYAGRMIVVGAMYGVISVAVLNYIAETNEAQGVTNGLNMMIQYAGMAVLPLIAGVVVMSTGYFWVFVFAGIAVLAGRSVCREMSGLSAETKKSVRLLV